MNFPGLDPLWSGFHHAAYQFGFIRPWTLNESSRRLAQDEKVLVVATTALGDSLLTTPLIETLAHHLGPARVSLLVKAPYVDLYKNDLRLHRVFSVRGKYRWNNLESELRADPHRIALLANVTEPDLIPALWRGGVRGFLRYRSRWTRFPLWMANRDMLRRPGTTDYAVGHAIENNLAMAEALGFEATTHRLALPYFKPDSGKKENVVLIHPGASREIKQWAPKNWARLADILVEEFGCEMALTGDGREKPLTQEIVRLMKCPAKNLAGELSLPEVAHLQSKSLAFLSGDTGPYHLALSVECPTVTLFAPTDRGSSTEACGPHQSIPTMHRAIQTTAFGKSISTLSLEEVAQESVILVRKSRARSEAK